MTSGHFPMCPPVTGSGDGPILWWTIPYAGEHQRALPVVIWTREIRSETSAGCTVPRNSSRVQNHASDRDSASAESIPNANV
jgi:hypothetical protein